MPIAIGRINPVQPLPPVEDVVVVGLFAVIELNIPELVFAAPSAEFQALSGDCHAASCAPAAVVIGSEEFPNKLL